MRQFETGKHALPRSLLINCALGDEVKQGVRGMWMKPTSTARGNGVISIGPSIAIDSMLSEKRDMEAAKRFFQQAVDVVGHAPERVTTDGHDSYPRAIRETLGNDVLHRTNHYLNNRLEQDHRGIKQRYYPLNGSNAPGRNLPSSSKSY